LQPRVPALTFDTMVASFFVRATARDQRVAEVTDESRVCCTIRALNASEWHAE
jgi:hypothetical protein